MQRSRKDGPGIVSQRNGDAQRRRARKSKGMALPGTALTSNGMAGMSSAMRRDGGE